ncbi:MAG: hypothetical protein ACI9LY_003871 [Arenicella sp.]
MRALSTLTEHRRKLVDDKVRITNRIRSALKQYYPQVLDWFDRIDTLVFCDFLERWPTLKQVKKARTATLKSFFGNHNMRRQDVLDRRLSSIKASRPLTEDQGVIIPNRLQVLVLVDLLRVTLASIKLYDEQINE